jgi:hypothetical protein
VGGGGGGKRGEQNRSMVLQNFLHEINFESAVLERQPLSRDLYFLMKLQNTQFSEIDD